MPRKRQGGMVPGTPGKAYQNRTDLSQQPSLPARVATNQTYGKATAQLQAQRTVPLAPPPTLLPSPLATQPAAAPPGGAVTSLSGPPGGGATPPPSPSPPATPGPLPGSFGDLHRPTERPFEPVTTGINHGPGAGPESILPAPGPNIATGSRVSDVLRQAAAATNSPVLSQMAARASAAGQ